MWTLSPRSLGGRLSRHAGAAVALGMCISLVACTGAETPPPAPTGKARTIAPLPEAGDIDPGTYLVNGYPVPFEITVADGWETSDGAHLFGSDPAHPEEGSVFFLTFWPADYVPTDACAWRGALVRVGPTAEAFADAMTAQTSTESTTPVEVMVGDYPGLEFDHSIASNVDITDCDDGRFCVHSDSAQECARWYSAPSERETYRVVDLNGERAVIALGRLFPESIDPALMIEARAVLDSIVFVAPDQ